jgi:hypothetical protein
VSEQLRQSQSIRAIALECAVRFLDGAKNQPLFKKYDEETVVFVAKYFADWIENGDA